MALFLLGRDAESIELSVRTSTATFVDVPAYLAAACALAATRSAPEDICSGFSTSSPGAHHFGRRPEPGEPLRWLLQHQPVSP